MEYIESVDKLDNEILKTIRHNARLSYSEIGEKVGLSRVAVAYQYSILSDDRKKYFIAKTVQMNCTEE